MGERQITEEREDTGERFYGIETDYIREIGYERERERGRE